jgi:glycerol-3-phosphate O-acyltransferase
MVNTGRSLAKEAGIRSGLYSEGMMPDRFFRLLGAVTRRARKIGQTAALIFVRYAVGGSATVPDGGQVCFVLERDQLFDRLVLHDLCAAQGWPRPAARLSDGAPAIWSLRSYRGWFARQLAPTPTTRLTRALAWLEDHPDDDVQLVPVAVFWGRSPAKERSWLKLLLAEDWAGSGRLHRFFAILAHGRQVLVKVSRPVSLRQLLDEGIGVQHTTRKAARLLRVHFRRQREATIGPDLSHRRLLVDEVLASPAVREAIEREAQQTQRSVRRIQARARRHAREIAAHYSHSVVRVLERVFGWVWNRLYEGIEVRHFESLNEIAVGAEIIYVPCHRSHIDYMLLSYVIYQRGLVPPHIAAGLNLDLPIIGPFLRRGGAFFIRRSFRGDALYSTVFRSYLAAIVSRGFPVEFFIEGTRSRTGRLLGPKLGLLGMTVDAYLADRRRPIVFVPVFFGYEKLVEGSSFLGELQGRRKQAESLGGALRSLRALRGRFGSVDVSFGEPIWLDEVLERTNPDWQQQAVEPFFRPAWVEAAVAALGQRIMTSINEAAVANAVGLTALIVLSTPKHAIVEDELRSQLRLYIDLLQIAPYAARTGVTGLEPAAIVTRCEDMGWLERRAHRLGDVMSMSPRRAVLASYFRNNIIHLFALPGLIAASLNNCARLEMADLVARLRRIYPCFKGELFLRFESQVLDLQIERLVAGMASVGLVTLDAGQIRRPIEGTPAAAQFALCGGIVEPFVEHYYLCVSFLLEQRDGGLDRAAVAARCADAAGQLAMLYTLSSPDLFEEGLFANFIESLVREGLVTEASDGRLIPTDPLAQIAEDLGVILRPRVRQTLRLFAGAAMTAPFGAVATDAASMDRSAEPS